MAGRTGISDYPGIMKMNVFSVLQGRRSQIIRFAAGSCLAACLLAGGCVSGSSKTGPGTAKVLPYTPKLDGRNIMAWGKISSGGTNSGMGMSNQQITNRITALMPGTRTLRKGDRVIIYLKDIPKEDEISTVIADSGEITLPYIRTLNIEGNTIAEAQTAIQQKYIQDGYYKAITVIMVAQEGEFYVAGEVNKAGKIPLSGEVSLMMAIAMAGDFNVYADKRRVEVKSGQEVVKYDCEKILKGEIKDPLIKTGDFITVRRRPW